MQPQEFQQELLRRGLVVLAVGQHQRNPEVLLVYLHGMAGQWAQGYAREVICSVPGVLAVSDSEQTPTIVLVRMRTRAQVVEKEPR